MFFVFLYIVFFYSLFKNLVLFECFRHMYYVFYIIKILLNDLNLNFIFLLQLKKLSKLTFLI